MAEDMAELSCVNIFEAGNRHIAIKYSMCMRITAHFNSIFKWQTVWLRWIIYRYIIIEIRCRMTCVLLGFRSHPKFAEYTLSIFIYIYIKFMCIDWHHTRLMYGDAWPHSIASINWISIAFDVDKSSLYKVKAKMCPKNQNGYTENEKAGLRLASMTTTL